MPKKWWIALGAALLGAVLLLLQPYDGPKPAENPLPPLETAPPVYAAPVRELIDLNTAGAEQLMTLPGIGQSRAAAIVSHRERYGPFQSVEELAAVEGIGPGILAQVRQYVTVTP